MRSMRSFYQQLLPVHFSVPACCQRRGRVRRGHPQSPNLGGLLPLTTWCLCCHVCISSLLGNGQDKQKRRDDASLLATFLIAIFSAQPMFINTEHFESWQRSFTMLMSFGGYSTLCCHILQGFHMYTIEGLLKIDKVDCEEGSVILSIPLLWFLKQLSGLCSFFQSEILPILLWEYVELSVILFNSTL